VCMRRYGDDVVAPRRDSKREVKDGSKNPEISLDTQRLPEGKS